MPLSYTYLELQLQILDELGDRSDLLAPTLSTANATSPIKRAIQSAIAKWEREPFYFTEEFGAPATIFTTVAGQARYGTADAAEIATDPYIYHLRITANGTRSILAKRSWLDLDSMETNSTARGQPTDWGYFGKEIRLYPTPDAAYTIQGARIEQASTITADSGTNVWLQDGYDLIRCEAIAHLARGILRDPALAAQMEAQIHGPRGYLYALKAETTRRAKTRIKPSQF